MDLVELLLLFATLSMKPDADGDQANAEQSPLKLSVHCTASASVQAKKSTHQVIAAKAVAAFEAPKALFTLEV